MKTNNQQDGRINALYVPKNKLTELERQRIINIVNEPAYADLSPSKIVQSLADKGIYVASKSTEPNQIYSWDITYLPTTVKGVFFYLYVVIDIYSRKIVGWQVHDQESSEFASVGNYSKAGLSSSN